MDVFKHIHPDAKLIVAKSVWQYSHHVLAGLRDASRTDPDRRQLERGVARSGRDAQPERLDDQSRARTTARSGATTSPTTFSSTASAQWIRTGKISHDTSHVRDLDSANLPAPTRRTGARRWPQQLQHDKAILGVFDEGCMGMYNAIINDELLNPLGIYKERLSQSALVAGMRAGQRRRSASGARLARRARRDLHHRARRSERTSPTRKFSSSARCTSPRCGSPMISAATRSAFSISRV